MCADKIVASIRSETHIDYVSKNHRNHIGTDCVPSKNGKPVIEPTQQYTDRLNWGRQSDPDLGAEEAGLCAERGAVNGAGSESVGWVAHASNVYKKAWMVNSPTELGLNESCLYIHCVREPVK